ncbi:MAG: murein L,D-transpeptidase [Dolichospermum sp. JUN01]|nr:murein L,D-transpeptidase [Dolichospermum sp. JUN01]MBS9392692.1 L,D-transpeptidase [Dolichospermum sp. OL01]MCO5796330.1 L,D-transpeptidase [Dolichospermum sp. OL03]MCS6279860.1 L,D-transpeptidase [Dolichospermum sp.]QSV57946.1 MAG: murein L,D-transpeptidase [Dolichospermum sp. LBC05a]
MPIMNTESVRKKIKQQRIIFNILLFFAAGSVFYWLLLRIGLIFPVTTIPEILCITNCQTEQKIHKPIIENELLYYDQPIEKLIINPVDKQKISLLIEKSKHRLTIYYNLKPIKSYPVVFGANPIGDKRGEGDKRTPEGILQIQDLYPHPQWSKFMWLNYPHPQSWRKHFQAKINGQLAWNIPIGGEVGIHGVLAGGDVMIDARNNWTLGCPSLKNKDVDELYQLVQKGTVVEILP